MSVDSPSLEELRRQIDSIDEVLHQELIRRSALIEDVSRAKAREGSAGSAMRPGREAQILRRLAARHEGRLPLSAILRIWRELINAITALQGPFAVAVCAPQKSVGYWDLARNHFGANTPMTLHVAASVAVRNVVEHSGTIGVLPYPDDETEEPWWLLLATRARSSPLPRVIWRLPFYASPSGRYENLEALVIACLTPEATGDDESVAAFECDLDVSRGRLLDALEAVGLQGRIVTSHEGSGLVGRMHLVLIDGFVHEDDPRLKQLAESMNEMLLRAEVLGAYPRPMGNARAAAETFN
jgi:chorismate mutase / prephenate dehydratase